MQKLSVWSAAFALAGMAAAAQAGGLETPLRAVSGMDTASAIDGFTTPTTKSVEVRAAEMAMLHAWLVADAGSRTKASGLRVELSEQERFSIGEIDACAGCAAIDAAERRKLVGIDRQVDFSVDAGQLKRATRTADGGIAWTLPVSSPGASGLRVGFANMDLPLGAELYVFNDAGEAHGPYIGRGMNNSGELVSHMVSGDRAYVQLRVLGPPSKADLARLRFVIDSVGHIGPEFELARRMNSALAGEKAFCDFNATCVVNGECASGWAHIANTRQAIAHMLFKSGRGYYICSGGLLNNSRNDGAPLFLTANHCLSREREADTLEAYFDFRASSCGDTGWCDYSYTQLRSAFPSTLGAALLAAGSSGDYSLLQLDHVPAGTRHYMGWSTAAVATSDGTGLFRISHPGGAPQAWSTHAVNANGFQCGTLPRGTFIYSNDSAGATEGGSSGSPVLNANGQVVGQLYGACGSNLGDTCDSQNNLTVDGALAQYFPNVAAWLDPSGGGGGGEVTASVDSVAISKTGKGPWTHYTATIRISDQDGNPVGNATVSGSWSGAVSGSASATTAGSGTASVTQKTKTPGNVQFCVTGVAGSGITFDGTTVCGSGS